LISFAIKRCAVRLAIAGCALSSSANVNPVSDARILVSKSVVDSIALWRRSKYMWRDYGAVYRTAPYLTRKVAQFFAICATLLPTVFNTS
jgi:hypothetical protein